MKQFIKFDDDHAINVEKKEDGACVVDFMEYYTACGWRTLNTEVFADVEAVEWYYDVKIA